jgi:hypothetical protein
MRSKEPPRSKRSQRIENGRGDGRFKIYSLMFVCLLILIAGFFFAARQHFAAIDYGIRNSRLRKQLSDLETEKRRLMVVREVSLSPIEIRKSAKKLGITGDNTELAKLEKGDGDLRSGQSGQRSLIKTTAESAPILPTISSAFANSGKGHRPDPSSRRSPSDQFKKPKPQIASLVATR